MMDNLRQLLATSLLLMAVAGPADAVPIHYSVEYDPDLRLTTVTNFLDSQGSLETFSDIAPASADGGSGHPVFIAPGAIIQYGDTAGFEASGRWWTLLAGSTGDAIETQAGKVETPTKTWNGTKFGDTRWWVLPPNGTAWTEVPEDRNGLGVSTWVCINQLGRIQFVDTNPKYNFDGKGGTKGAVFHLGKEGKESGKPPVPPPAECTTSSSLTHPLDGGFFSPFSDHQAQVLLLAGTIEVAQADSASFFGVYTETAAVGIVPEPRDFPLVGVGLACLVVVRRLSARIRTAA